MTIEGVEASSPRSAFCRCCHGSGEPWQHDDKNINTSQAVIAQINRSVDRSDRRDLGTNKRGARCGNDRRNRRFMSAKAATLSEAADVARAAARQLTDARTRILDEVARAKATGFVCAGGLFGKRLDIANCPQFSARDHAAAIRARSPTSVLSTGECRLAFIPRPTP